MIISKRGLNLIKKWEALRLTAYQDTGGVWTIGYGHTGLDVKRDMTITKARADELLAADVKWAENGVKRALGGAAVTQNQFDAMVSLAFNIGLHAFRVSTLLRKFKAGDVAGAAGEFPKWKYDGGVVVDGLVNRRAAERALFERTT